MKKATSAKNTNQMTFSFEEATATRNAADTGLLLPVMSHMADRLHAKIEMMLSMRSMDSNVSLVIKQDDRDALVAAIDGNNSALSDEQLVCLESIANMAIATERKLYLSYEQVEQLFNAVRH